MDNPALHMVPQPAISGQPLKIAWKQPSGLLGLSLTNAILRLLTLGIYNFWGKTEVRKRIWSAVRVDGEPLSYTGTGRELFLGFLVIFAIVILPMLLLSMGVVFFFGPQSPAVGIFQMLLYVFIFLLTGIAIYRAQRYRLSRTRWRGIRGSLVGSDRAYAWAYSWSALLIPLTMGWIMPWRTTMLQGLITRDTRFGDRPFRFNAKPGPLYPSFSVFWIGCTLIAILAFAAIAGAIGGLMGTEAFMKPNFDPKTTEPAELAKLIGIIYGVIAVAFLFYYILSAWYRARQINHFTNHTRFEGAALRSTVTGFGLVKVALGNFLLTILGWSIGIGVFVAIAGISGLFTGANPQSSASQLAIIAGVIVLIACSGLFSPFVQARNARYLVQNLSILGHVPLEQIAQGADQGITRGEGLAQAFDVDAF